MKLTNEKRKMKELPIDFMKSCQHGCNISFDVQNNIFNNIMPSRIMCVISINNRQPCLQTVVYVSHHEYFSRENFEVLISLQFLFLNASLVRTVQDGKMY